MRMPVTSLVVALVLLLGNAPLAVAAQRSDADALAFLIAQARQQPSLVGPLTGELPIEANTVSFEPAGLNPRDFYARVAFASPYPGEQHLWDVGISFRRTSPDEDYRFILDSEGSWFFKEGLQDPSATGQVAGLASGAGGITRIDLVAFGETGYLAINGGYVATLDLSARDIAGDVAIGTGFYAEDHLDGESTPYAEFEIWALAAAPAPATAAADGGTGEGGGVVLQDAGQVIFELPESPGSEIFGAVSLTARDGQTDVQVSVFGTTGAERVGIAAGTCQALALGPPIALAPVDPETLTSLTTVDIPYAELADGTHAVTIRADDGAGSLLACAEIPAS